MKAIVQTRYGSPEEVLELREIDVPRIADDEVLVRVRATSVHADIWHVVAGLPRLVRAMGSGLFKPKSSVPGTDLAGVVESAGAGVTRFEVGDAVFGESQRKMQWSNGGAFAEYAAVPEQALAQKPEAISFEQAAAVPTPGYIALVNLPDESALPPGSQALINGAGGNVGSIALQVLKARGVRVTGVDTAAKAGIMLQLGADRVIDFAEADFTEGDERYDLIFDVASTLSLKRCKRVLKPQGTYVIIGHDHFGTVGSRTFGSLPRFFRLMARAPFDRHLPKLSFSIPPKQPAMAELKSLLEDGELTPVIDRTFPLDQVPAAMRYLQEGGGIGRIIITL